MQMIPFGDLGVTVSRLGMGCMRLPTRQEGDQRVIDRPAAIALIRNAIDGGVTYVDTAYGYHNRESEIVTGLALKDGYRRRVSLATKLPCWYVEKESDMDRLLDEQLGKLQVDSVDFYLLHALNKSSFEKMQRLGYQRFLEKAKADGRIRFASFSFHDNAETFRNIVDDYDWDMAQVQLNYLDDEDQATLEGVRYAGGKGIGIVVMEPLRGGALASPPENVAKLIEAQTPKRSPVNWAFAWLTQFPEVKVILSGMSNQQQLDENLAFFANTKTEPMPEDEQRFVQQIKKAYLERIQVGCTGCRYCMPCPHDVAITDLFLHYDEAHMLDRLPHFKDFYQSRVEKKSDASLCVECGACESACPQGIPIIESLKRIRSEYGA